MRNGSARLPDWWYARRRNYYPLPRSQRPVDSSNPPPPSQLLLRLPPLSPRRRLRKYYLFVSSNCNSLPCHSLCPPTPLFYRFAILQCRRHGCTDSESIRVPRPGFYRPLRKIHQGQIPAVREVNLEAQTVWHTKEKKKCISINIASKRTVSWLFSLSSYYYGFLLALLPKTTQERSPS